MLAVYYNLLSAYNYRAATIACGVLMCVLAVVAIALIVITLMQKSTDGEVTSLTGGSSDTYYNKNKEMDKDKKLKIATIVLAAVLVVSAIVFFIVAPGI